MCDRRGWHEAEAEVRALGGGLTLGQKCHLHLALRRDSQLTFGETLAKLTAGREAAREAQPARTEASAPSQSCASLTFSSVSPVRSSTRTTRCG